MDDESEPLVFGPGTDWSLVADRLAGCSCVRCDADCSCRRRSDVYVDGRLPPAVLTSPAASPLFECNSACSCGPACDLRVVQRRLRDPAWLEVRPTGDARGLGVFAGRRVLAGECVCVYRGEVVGAEEARRREAAQTRAGGHTYVLTVRERALAGGAVVTRVDGRAGGAAARINHGCEPNCGLATVRVDCMLPLVAVFAVRDLSPGAELLLDYGDGTSTRPCLCGATACRRFLPHDPE